SGPSAWTGDEHLCVGPRIDAARSAHGGSQRPRYRRYRDRELHGIGGYTAGNSGGFARACGLRNRLWGGGFSWLAPFCDRPRYIFSGREMPSISRTSARVSFVFKTKYKSSTSRSEPITFTSR